MFPVGFSMSGMPVAMTPAGPMPIQASMPMMGLGMPGAAALLPGGAVLLPGGAAMVGGGGMMLGMPVAAAGVSVGCGQCRGPMPRQHGLHVTCDHCGDRCSRRTAATGATATAARTA